MNHSDTIKDKYRKQIIRHSSHVLTQAEAESIFTSTIFQNAQHIGCYKALKPEINIEKLLSLFVKHKKRSTCLSQTVRKLCLLLSGN